MSIKIERLYDILSTMRPAYSQEEEKFCNKFLDIYEDMRTDMYGNRYMKIGESRTMFSCHTDTVHRQAGTQRIVKDGDLFRVIDSNCLGADDGAGVEVMLSMIDAEVPGLYVFHKEEEIGGNGSDFFAEGINEGDYDRCIAFDRRGTTDVITVQFGGDCCSLPFAQALAAELGMGYKPSPNGIFTDSANYTHKIPECTNLSVGYEHEHTSTETLNWVHLAKLTDKCINQVNWEDLPTVRSINDMYDPYEDFYSSAKDTVNHVGNYNLYDPPPEHDFTALEDWCYYHPEYAADYIEQLRAQIDDQFDDHFEMNHEQDFQIDPETGEIQWS